MAWLLHYHSPLLASEGLVLCSMLEETGCFWETPMKKLKIRKGLDKYDREIAPVYAEMFYWFTCRYCKKTNVLAPQLGAKQLHRWKEQIWPPPNEK